MPTIYRVRMFKSWNGRNTENEWSNTYDIATTMDIEDDGWAHVLEQLQAFEASAALNKVNFLRAVVSTAKEDKEAYPKNLRVFELVGVGNRAIPADDRPVPLDIALVLKKQVAYGRSGRLYLRGFLLNSDISIDGSGGVTLAGDPLPPAAIANMWGFWRALFGQDQQAWVMPTKAELETGTTEFPNARLVTGIQMSGATLVDRDRDRKRKTLAGAQD